MKLPERTGAMAGFPAARLLRLAAIGLICALLVVVVGRLAERLALGGDTAAARKRAEADVQRVFAGMAAMLEAATIRLADSAAVSAAAQDDVAASRRLFERSAAVTAADGHRRRTR